MKKFLRLCLLLVLLTGCANNNSQEAPQGTLPMPKMAAILADIHLAEAAVALQGLTFQEALSRYDRYEREIMRRHQTDTITYRRSYQFYASDSYRLSDLMKLVADTLTARQNRLRNDSTATTPQTAPLPQQ
ncbi:DUF4296 domain-containing protein [Rhodoflexus sp.]